jgi:hypothetical protein
LIHCPGEAHRQRSFLLQHRVAPSGMFVYASNRGHDSIAIPRIDPRDGALRYVGHEPTLGKTPRSFGIDPTRRFLLVANQDSDSVMNFRVDPDTGRLQPTGQATHVPTPVCVKFLATHQASAARQRPTIASTSALRKRSTTSMNPIEGTSSRSAVIEAIW